LSVPSAQVKACTVTEPAYLGHTVVADEEVAVMNVQVNHCVVELFGESSTSLNNNNELANDFEVKGPVTLKFGTHVRQQISPAEPVIGSENRKPEFDNSSSRIDSSMLDRANSTNSVRTSPLTHCHVYVENSGLIRCLVDSGSELSIAKRSMVDKIKPCANSVGQIKLQGVFGEPVVAELINLQLALANENDSVSNVMSVTFAVTNATVPDCDLIMPVEIFQELKAYAVSCKVCA